MTKQYHFLLGFVAGILTLLISFLLRIFVTGVFIPELATQTFFSLIPGGLGAIAVGTLGVLAKYSTFVGAIVVNLILYGVFGMGLLEVSKKQLRKSHIKNTLQFSLIVYVFVLIVALTLLRLTEVLTQPISLDHLMITLLPPHLLFGLILSYFNEKIGSRTLHITKQPLTSDQKQRSRRNFLRIGILGTFAMIVSIYGLRRIFNRPVPPSTNQPPISTPDKDLLLKSEVTPNDLFFNVSINVISPTLDINEWRLQVTGLVNNPLTLTYETMRSMQAVERYSTLECISNSIGGGAIGTALWKGVPLRTFLEQAQVQPEAKFIVFRCLDGYDVGIPLERGLSSKTILAYEMNGVPLPFDHGYPLRASIPGIYGIMHAKWITEIELVDKTYLGFWQRKGWSNKAEVQTQSVIVTPGNSSIRNRFKELKSQSSRVVIGDKVLISGIAYAGDRGISNVEVSVDGGTTWNVAEFKEPLSEDSWVLWFLEWIPTTIGKYKIIVRAVDKTGALQIVKRQGSFPDGATGYHSVNIEVTES